MQAAAACDRVADLFIVKLEPLARGSGPDVSIVVASVDTSTVHQHAVQLVQVAHTAVSIWGQELAILHI